jgi:hypothetical protein
MTRLHKYLLVLAILVVLVCFLAGARADEQGDRPSSAATNGDLSGVKALPAAKASVDATMERARVAHWQEDLDDFAREFPARQKDCFLLVPQDRFKSEVMELKRQVPQFSDRQILFNIMRIVASLGVAHTSVALGSASGTMALHSYPIRMQWFSDGLAVVAAAPEYQEALGSRVLWIGSRTPEQVEAALAPYIPHENDAYLHFQSPLYMKLIELMQQEQFADSTGRLHLICAKAGGKEFALEIPPESSIPSGRTLMKAAETLHIPAELSRKYPGVFYWYEYLPETKTLYIQYNHCRNDLGKPFASFTKDLFAFADAHPVQRVIVDLRFNGGGDSSVLRPLVEGLKSRPKLAAKGHLYTLIGSQTFSSAILAAMDFRDRLHAILVGEPTGNKPNHYGDQKRFLLPNSKLMVQYSTKHFTLIQDADPSTLAPDILVPYSVDDFLAGRDPVLEATLHHPLP